MVTNGWADCFKAFFASFKKRLELISTAIKVEKSSLSYSREKIFFVTRSKCLKHLSAKIENDEEKMNNFVKLVINSWLLLLMYF